MRVTVVVFLLLFGPPGFAEQSTDRVDGVEPCIEHFSEEGNFFKGRKFATWQAHEGATYDTAFRKVAQAISREGWKNMQADKDLGIITAELDITMGEGATAPLNVVIETTEDEAIRVEAVFRLAGGMATKKADVRRGLCEIVRAVRAAAD